jgi:hypothetical protein
MYDDSAGGSPPAVAGVGICNRIVASRCCGSVQVAAGAINNGLGNAGATGTANTLSANPTAATARGGAQGCAIRAC